MLATALVSGLSLGSIYGLIALGFTLTFAVSGTVNFAQGSSVMLGAVMCHALSIGMHWPILAAIPASLVVCAIWGLGWWMPLAPRDASSCVMPGAKRVPCRDFCAAKPPEALRNPWWMG